MLQHCLAKPGSWLDHPFGPDIPVIKVSEHKNGKVFVFLTDVGIGVKAGPSREVADEWLHRYPQDASVMAYLGRSGWNDLAIEGAIPDEELVEAMDESYRLVVSTLPVRHRPVGWDA